MHNERISRLFQNRLGRGLRKTRIFQIATWSEAARYEGPQEIRF
ncbi:hypothetical protein LEP1GSC079_1816 [Leptospira interrogans str. FPW1039]|uniref:Uncharacterized protein n=2 Tax=Leptospira interrogans TaxID=173 RepID=A0A0F6IIQ4_LEPIR|nr:hypothetical protein G436_2383 [Leptospira interrogans serovar Hardjo str. Norma]EKO96093.1 hypothetical protein LEP1GSC057_1787 [Leptospira interrogans str. Brem 329]EKR84551.1 hypothetical protein LEP1GSC099_1758 [Leptospira interrogans str. UI 08452]EMJ37929.1 hypothetical protein LEP1GSC079_1816 [Leptospira interrogans str. FPW1039]